MFEQLAKQLQRASAIDQPAYSRMTLSLVFASLFMFQIVYQQVVGQVNLLAYEHRIAVIENATPAVKILSATHE